MTFVDTIRPGRGLKERKKRRKRSGGKGQEKRVDANPKNNRVPCQHNICSSGVSCSAPAKIDGSGSFHDCCIFSTLDLTTDQANLTTDPNLHMHVVLHI